MEEREGMGEGGMVAGGEAGMWMGCGPGGLACGGTVRDMLLHISLYSRKSPRSLRMAVSLNGQRQGRSGATFQPGSFRPKTGLFFCIPNRVGCSLL